MQRRIERDSGISLIEVIVALVLIGAISATALVFFVRGMSTTTHLQRTQSASAVATQAMEAVRSIDPRSGADIAETPLISGRTQAEVNAAWSPALAAGHVTTGEMTQLWDATAAGSDPQLLPIHTQSTIDRFTYDVTTLVGQCNVLKANLGNESECSSAAAANKIPVIRVRIIVEWQDGEAGRCSTSDCSYALTTLIDPSEDANWNLSTKPVAYDDAASFTIGQAPAFMDILANDVLATFTSNPTTILTGPTGGFGSVAVINSGTGMGGVNFTAPPATSAAQSGETNFTYKVRDAQGRNSNTASVRVIILPLAQNDTAIVARNGQVEIPVLANDYGTSLTPEIQTPPDPGVGAITMNADNTFTFIPNSASTATSASFTYVVHDAYSSQSLLPATVTIEITDPTPEVSDDVEFVIDAQDEEKDVTIDLLEELEELGVEGLTSDTRINIVSDTDTDLGKLETNGSDKKITLKLNENQIGVVTFEYTLQEGENGLPSETATARIIAVPVAKNYEVKTKIGESEEFTLSFDAENIPDQAHPDLTYKVATSPTCGELTVLDPTSGKMNFTGGTEKNDCTETYTITMTQSGFTYVTEPAEIEFEVTD